MCLVKVVLPICLEIGCCARASSSMPCPQAFVATSAPNLSIYTFGISSAGRHYLQIAGHWRHEQSASTILENLRKAQMANDCASLSPGCCAQQLLHETSIHCAWAQRVGAHDVGLNCVRGLTACELAVAIYSHLYRRVDVHIRMNFTANICRPDADQQSVSLKWRAQQGRRATAPAAADSPEDKRSFSGSCCCRGMQTVTPQQRLSALRSCGGSAAPAAAPQHCSKCSLLLTSKTRQVSLIAGWITLLGTTLNCLEPSHNHRSQQLASWPDFPSTLFAD